MIISYLSLNVVFSQVESDNYSLVFINNIYNTELPVHNINIKIDISIQLLYTLNQQNLCYSIRLRVTSLESNVIEAAILMVTGKDDRVFIIRMPIVLSNNPFQFKVFSL